MDSSLPKTDKQLEKEAKKAAKLLKLEAKLQKNNRSSEECSSTHKIGKKKSGFKGKENDEKKGKILESSHSHPAPFVKGSKKDVTVPLPNSYDPSYVESQWYDWWKSCSFFKPEYGRESLLKVTPSQKFVIMIPPPNITGKLHLGHALTNSIQDSLVRWHRMKGKMVLWTPGTDHAGIATQVVVEKKLWKESQKNRHEIGREAFIQKVWDWKKTFGAEIEEQLMRLGSSLDWDRSVFTMDPKMCKAVTEAFVLLHEDGTIYRANRLVNWSCALKSAISDIEVDKMEISGPTHLSIPGYESQIQFGLLVSFAYSLVEEGEETGEVIVATTRLETMLGDTAIAVHPNDSRYSSLIGKTVVHPFFPSRHIPIIADEYVDPTFGSGAVKITPAHDPNDYEIGLRHNLPFLTIFDDEGRISISGCSFFGLKRFEARKAIEEELKARGLHRSSESHAMVLPLCSRSHDIIEPLCKPQWYVKCEEMGVKAKEAVVSGALKLIPTSFEKTWFSWMDGLRDWCISRQLWWGHRIPAYRVSFESSSSSSLESNEIWVTGRTKEEACSKAASLYPNTPASQIILTQDEDVLDTWFSSALFPFSAFGWPDSTEDLKAFYPGSLLETGHDIIFFWVARMVFLGQKLTGQLPFKTVYFHAMVRDAHGRKMSKSLGNVIDPLDVISGISLEGLGQSILSGNLSSKEIETALSGQKRDYPKGIPECGTDALRFALVSYTAQGRDINLDVLRVQGYRFFCNKIWNATKFALSYLKENGKDEKVPEKDTIESISTDSLSHWNSVLGSFENKSFLRGQSPSSTDFQLMESLQGKSPSYWTLPHLTHWFHRMKCLPKVLQKSSKNFIMDDWIKSRLFFAMETANDGMNSYNFPAVTTALYNFWLYELCDVYLESVKPIFHSESSYQVPLVEGSKRTLLTCLDVGLRLLAPFMPFLSEELYQRVKSSTNSPPSIVVAPYPESTNQDGNEVGGRNEVLETQFEFVSKVISAIRSLRSDYNLPHKKKVEVSCQIHDDDDLNSLSFLFNFEDVICTLAHVSKLTFVSNHEKLRGGVLSPISDQCLISLHLKDLINVESEKKRLEGKVRELEGSLNSLEGSMLKASYVKVPLEIQRANDSKVSVMKKELTSLQVALESLTM